MGYPDTLGTVGVIYFWNMREWRVGYLFCPGTHWSEYRIISMVGNGREVHILDGGAAYRDARVIKLSVQ